VSFLRRIMGGGDRQAGERPGEEPASRASAGGRAGGAGGGPGGSAADDEAARERELLLEEAHRLDNDLIQRQMRYADRAWTPPAQGGTRRADDEDAEPER
jgi:hypothetical protein